MSCKYTLIFSKSVVIIGHFSFITDIIFIVITYIIIFYIVIIVCIACIIVIYITITYFIITYIIICFITAYVVSLGHGKYDFLKTAKMSYLMLQKCSVSCKNALKR